MSAASLHRATGAAADATGAQPAYHDAHYLLFGGDDTFSYQRLDCPATSDYLSGMGFANGSLSQARRLKGQLNRYIGYRDPDAHQCDFCGRALPGAEYDVLKDGRERCARCTATVVKTRQEFETLFAKTREGLCLKYGINLPSSIEVKVVSQKKMAKVSGEKEFVPTKAFDPRTVGLAVNKKGTFSMYFENGTPKGSLTATAAHELTHIWQYSTWDWQAMEKRYGDDFLAVVEGMAKWSEIQYLYLLNETAFADRSLANEVARTDVYGYGLRLYLQQYPLSRGIVREGPTPFDNTDLPLEL